MTSLILLPGLASNEALWGAQREALAPWSPHVTDVHMREETIEAMAATLLREHAGALVLCGASMGGRWRPRGRRRAGSPGWPCWGRMRGQTRPR